MIERMRRTTRLGLVLLADRVAAAVTKGGRVIDTFAIVDAEHPAETLRAEIESRRLRPRGARLGVQRSFVVVKALDLPPAVNGDVGQMVQFELERHVPFPADDAAFDFTMLPTAGDGPRVLVVALERRTVERALHVLDEVKLRPTSLTVAAHDLVSLLPRRPRGARAVWVHRVGDQADLLLIAGNTLLASRSVAAADTATLAAEIRGSLAMLRWAQCDALWVSGDGASSIQASPALGAIGLLIDRPPLSARARRALGAVGELDDGAALLAAAVATGPRSPRPDLLPVVLRPRRLSREQRATIGMVAVTVLLGLGTLLAQGVRDQRQLSRLEAANSQLAPEVRAVQRVMDKLDRERRLLATVRTITAASLRPLPVLRELTETLPPDVWLTTLTLDQKVVEMTGQAATASALIPLLENSPLLEHVEFASPVTRGRDKEQFRIRAVWEVNPGANPREPPPPPPTRPAPPRTVRPRPEGVGAPGEMAVPRAAPREEREPREPQ